MLGGSLNEVQIPTGYQPGYNPIYSLILNFFSKNWFWYCDCGSPNFQRTGFWYVIVVLKNYEKVTESVKRLVMKTLKPKTLNPKNDPRPFHENLHFFEVFEIIRTDNSLLPIFFSKEMKPTII